MDQESHRDLIRLTEEARDQVLSHLDEAAARPSERDERRTLNRIAYRAADIPVVIRKASGEEERFVVAGRNLSAQGMAFIHGAKVATGARCEVTLRARDGAEERVPGEVIGCRLLGGHLHEVSMRFRKTIDPRRFLAPDAATAIMDAVDGRVSETVAAAKALGAASVESDLKRIEALCRSIGERAGRNAALREAATGALESLKKGECTVEAREAIERLLRTLEGTGPNGA
ncbi:MAG: hypothetical protein VYC34_04150 [Planctomycetota bacterium]|nr:hypothetical protein [Planctomycetota bacterium]